MYRRKKPRQSNPIVLFVPVAATAAFGWQLITGTAITTRLQLIRRTDMPEAYWVCIAVQIAILALLWSGMVHIIRRQN